MWGKPQGSSHLIPLCPNPTAKICIRKPYNPVIMSTNIPVPCPERVREFVDKFDKHENYRVGENALSYLLQCCPHNNELEHVLLKVAAINQFYSTHVLDPYSVATRIFALKIDQRLAAGDHSLVAELTPMELGEEHPKTRHLYSFATKYCNRHQPAQFPIYDSFVEKMLLHFRTVNNFDNFAPLELKEYRRFVDLLSKFKMCFGLQEFTTKQLDIYLWTGGKEYFA
jgi:hypothetical protein